MNSPVSIGFLQAILQFAVIAEFRIRNQQLAVEVRELFLENPRQFRDTGLRMRRAIDRILDSSHELGITQRLQQGVVEYTTIHLDHELRTRLRHHLLHRCAVEYEWSKGRPSPRLLSLDLSDQEDGAVVELAILFIEPRLGREGCRSLPRDKHLPFQDRLGDHRVPAFDEEGTADPAALEAEDTCPAPVLPVAVTKVSQDAGSFVHSPSPSGAVPSRFPFSHHQIPKMTVSMMAA